MTMKTPEQIAHENIDDLGRSSLGRLFPVDRAQLLPIVVAAIEADRAQRLIGTHEEGCYPDPRHPGYWYCTTEGHMPNGPIQSEIYIVQNDAGDVVGVFRDADEATAAYQEGYSVIEETVTEPGEYALPRIAELTAEWEAATSDTASDYVLSEDDWRVGGLDDDEAAEIVRLIAWKESAE
jgi:hypothetical protein